jgi:serine/threonine protein kinase
MEALVGGQLPGRWTVAYATQAPCTYQPLPAPCRCRPLQEALLLQHLRHPNLVGFFGLSLTASKGVILMELCEGRDLQSALQLTATATRERLFGWRGRGRRVAYEVAKAVNYLHTKGVTHMDIKSGNVLLTASGEARLSDVGLSRHQSLLGQSSDARCIGTFAW